MATTKQYLDYTGLQTLIAKIKATFLSKTEASSTYLTQTSASSTYLTQANATNTYLTKSDATNTYLTKSDASSTYLTQTNASSTYLTKSDATNTYLTDVTVSNNDGLVVRTPSTGGAKTIALNFNGLKTKLEGIDSAISGLSNAVHFVGVTETSLTDGSTTKTIKINNEDYTAKSGDIVIKGDKEFVFDGSKWCELGDTSAAINGLNSLKEDLYGKNGTVASPITGSFVATVKSDLSTLKTWKENHVDHGAIPATGTNSVEAAWNAGMA